MANTPIKFIDDSSATALSDAIADYQAIAGRTLGNADPEMLIINAFAVRVAQLRSQINYVGNQNLVNIATGTALDELGAKFGVFRLDASPAQVSLLFTTVAGAPDVTIPAGTRVKSQDGLVLFATNISLTIVTGALTGAVDCTCLTTGVIGNGYLPGMVNIIVDPVAYVTTAANVDATTGGSDTESDDGERARIILASATFSVAGPTDAYIYFAKSASPAIIDVKIQDPTPVPGTVYIYCLLIGGIIADSATLDLVEAICSDKKVRPLNDTVVALAPTQINYSINAAFTVKAGYNSAAVAAQALANLNGFVNVWTGGYGALGVDVVVDQLKGQCMSVPGMYSVDFGLLADISIDDTQFANCTSVTGTVAAVVNEI